MSESITIEKPKYLDLLRGVCILIACLGLIGTILLIPIFATPAVRGMFEASGVTPLKSLLSFIEFAILFVASVWLLKLKEIGRKLMLIIFLINIVEYIYNSVAALSLISLTNIEDFVSIALFVFNLFAVSYFSRNNVKAYVRSNR